MITETEIARINVLYHKMKAEGLTAAEKEEQAILRGKYIASVRANLKSQLNQIDVENPDGTVISLKDRLKKEKKYEH